MKEKEYQKLKSNFIKLYYKFFKRMDNFHEFMRLCKESIDELMKDDFYLEEENLIEIHDIIENKLGELANQEKIAFDLEDHENNNYFEPDDYESEVF